MSRIGDRVRELRTKKGLNEKQLGKKMGVSESFIKEVEAGRRILNEGTADRFSKILGTNISTQGFSAGITPVQNPSRAQSVKEPNNKQKSVPSPQWQQAFKSIIAEIPVYNIDLSAVLDVKRMVMEDGKVMGFSPERIQYVAVADDTMSGWRLMPKDRVFIHQVGDYLGEGIYLIKENNKNALRFLRREENNSYRILRWSDKKYAHTVENFKITILGKASHTEMKLP